MWKNSLCHTLCVAAQLPTDMGGEKEEWHILTPKVLSDQIELDQLQKGMVWMLTLVLKTSLMPEH